MAAGNFFQNMKQRVQSAYNNFFYPDMDAPAPATMEQGAGTAQADPVQQPMSYPQPQVNYPQPAQGNYQQPTGYPQPAQLNYQQPPQTTYQQPTFSAPQVDMNRQGGRGRRASQRAAGNVLELDRYQTQQPAAAQQPAAMQQTAAQQPAQPRPEADAQNMWVINVRGMSDCCSAISLLREGGTVLAVMENITDPPEMRRLVDTLSGACYSLSATITKLSRGGVYLLASRKMVVYTDQATKMMNSAGSRSYSYQQQPAPRQGIGVSIPPLAGASPRREEPAAAPRQQGFARQQAVPADAPSFFARPAPRDAAIPEFTAAPTNGSGYRPDDLTVGGF